MIVNIKGEPCVAIKLHKWDPVHRELIAMDEKLNSRVTLSAILTEEMISAIESYKDSIDNKWLLVVPYEGSFIVNDLELEMLTI